MKKIVVVLSLIMATQLWAQSAIEMGILLDSSGSMGGLINKTRNILWVLINDLENARKDGETPKIRIGLYSYGNSSHIDAVNEIVKISDLTTDHDSLSQEFFKLNANGSSELAGTVVHKALSELTWSSNAGFKALYLAGNETLKQGEITIADSAQEAFDSATYLNTIYASSSPMTRIPRSPVDSIMYEWKFAAMLSNSNFAHINQNSEDIYIEAPQDKLILALDKKLNLTFIPFGKNGTTYYNRMLNVDDSINRSSIDSMINRGRYKVGHNYDTSTWDLVDAYNKKKVDLSKLTEQDLPDELKGKDTAEILAYIQTIGKKRLSIQLQTKQLYKEREKYVAKKKRDLAAQGKGNPLETQMISALRSQLKDNGYTFIDEE